jgi:DUF1680 family protein
MTDKLSFLRRSLYSCILIGAIASSATACLAAGSRDLTQLSEKELARRIRSDQTLTQVHGMAKDLLKSGLNAGSGYSEVWIRDLNTFIEVALQVNPPERLREALLIFLKFQGATGDIVDGYVPLDQAKVKYAYRTTALATKLMAHKNTVETDQEASLVQAVRKYIRVTGDTALLDERVDGVTVRDRLGRALQYLLTERFDTKHGLIWGATTADWGDVQPESPWGVELDEHSHRTLDIYDNAMLVIALNDYLALLGDKAPEAARWKARRDELKRNVRQHLWDPKRRKFIPHVYLAGSPFPKNFDEDAIYYHGGTAVAIEAGLLTRKEALQALDRMVANVKAAGAASIGLTLYPPYPEGFFKNPQMRSPYSYQNGGDWCWFGGRMIQELIKLGYVAQAYRELQPMVERVKRAGGFHEWWSVDNQPRGSGEFRGSAGVLGRAIEMLQAWAEQRQPLAKAGLTAARDYPISPVPFTAVRIQDEFWTPRFETNRLTTVWYDFKKCEETGRIDNFAKAGGLMAGKFVGSPFDDSDVFKVIQGAAYTLATHPDPKLDSYLDALIAKIAAAQEPDGYLYTARTLKSGSRRAGKDRWLNERGAQSPGEDSHELYNVGHLYEAAAAHYQATGKTNLLHIALRNANLVAETWGPGKLEIPSGHQEVEIGLIKLYRVTGDEKYLRLAKFLLDCRGNGKYEIPPGHLGDRYYSDHEPVTQQTEAVGHSVRSTYMYSAMADVAAILGDTAYSRAVDALWHSVVGRKTYLTGGIGADASTEGFGPDYALPNDSYNETCAAIGNALWNQRMFLLHGQARYADVLERIIYNGFLAGVALTGDKFFYPNPLVCDGKHKFNQGALERSPWFGCSCCPVNDVRFIPEIASYIYATREDELFVNLFIGGTATAQVGNTIVELRQQTRYPWNGRVLLAVNPQTSAEFTLQVRIPGWARNEPLPSDLYHYADSLKPRTSLTVNGRPLEVELANGYAGIRRKWKAGDTVALDLEMPVRRVVAHPQVQAAANCVALERGPLVYCAEGADNGGRVLTRRISGAESFTVVPRPDLLGGIVTIKTAGVTGSGDPLTLIPYYAWCHRGTNEMRVWFPTR